MMTDVIPITVDLISDLNLSVHDTFDWTGKSSSLICVIAGNISSDLNVVKRVLEHLADCYRGVLYIDGNLEHTSSSNYYIRIHELKEICATVSNVVYLHNHAVILNNVAFIACNGWYDDINQIKTLGDFATIEERRTTDFSYLSSSIKKLQSYADIEQIVLITHSVPTEYLTYNSGKAKFPEKMGLGIVLTSDDDHKVSHWLFGSDNVDVDVVLNGRHYCNNSANGKNPYWPKCVSIKTIKLNH